MNRITVSFAAAALAAAVAITPRAGAGVADLAEAMKILSTVSEITGALQTAGITVTAPTPLYDNSGAFLSPYRCDGTPAEWSNKAMTAGAGSAAGGAAAGALAAKVPFVGGLFSKKAKEIGGKQGAIVAAGGMDFIKSTSDLSFNTADELAVYLQAKHAGLDPDFAKRVSAAMSIFPELKTNYTKAVQSAADSAKAAAASMPAASTAAPAAPVDPAAAPAAMPVSPCPPPVG